MADTPDKPEPSRRTGTLGRGWVVTPPEPEPVVVIERAGEFVTTSVYAPSLGHRLVVEQRTDGTVTYIVEPEPARESDTLTDIARTFSRPVPVEPVREPEPCTHCYRRPGLEHTAWCSFRD